MRTPQSATSVLALFLIIAGAPLVRAQHTTEVRRAQPVEDTPVPRALPAEVSPSPTPRRAAAATPRPSATPRSVTTDATDELTSNEPPPQTEAQDKRQLDYANALFSRKLYDLAVPEYEKYLGQYPGAPGRASAYFYVAECYRALNRSASARSSFQSVIDNYGESEFAGPASY
ncbi:MAG: tetratricopeptide repeat protein, partial [Chthoniobacterales bacterium]